MSISKNTFIFVIFGEIVNDVEFQVTLLSAFVLCELFYIFKKAWKLIPDQFM